MAPQITMVSRFELQKGLAFYDQGRFLVILMSCLYLLVYLAFYFFLTSQNETWINFWTNRRSNQSESDHWWRKFHVATPPERVRIRQSLKKRPRPSIYWIHFLKLTDPIALQVAMQAFWRSFLQRLFLNTILEWAWEDDKIHRKQPKSSELFTN